MDLDINLNDMIKREYFTCTCNSIDHLIVFTKFIDNKNPEENILYLETHINPEYKLWKRIKNAIKYIFKFKSSYGDFDEFIFKSSDADRLQEVVDFLKTCKN